LSFFIGEQLQLLRLAQEAPAAQLRPGLLAQLFGQAHLMRLAPIAPLNGDARQGLELAIAVVHVAQLERAVVHLRHPVPDARHGREAALAVHVQPGDREQRRQPSP